ncbi:hypothetical protein EK21DRAFT_71510, partial [Setomelanomma holmii]
VMANYCDAGAQTIWAGLMHRETVRLSISPPTDTSTPPDDILTQKSQFVHGFPAATASSTDAEFSAFTAALKEAKTNPPLNMVEEEDTTPTLLQRRLSRPAEALSPPSIVLNDDDPAWPPTTRAELSPVPAANKLYAGHTPLLPPAAALSPTQETQESEDYFGQVAAVAAAQQQAAKDDDARTPDADESLKGALTLPFNPVDGTDEYIELDQLDAVLSKIARQQAILRGSVPQAPASQIKRDSAVDSGATDDGQPLSQTVSAELKKPKTYVKDGIVFKTGKTNFELPWGIAPKRDHRGSI